MSGVRQSNRPTLRNLNPVFHKRDKSEDNAVLSVQILKLARKTGQLKLCSRGLASVPDEVYNINEADKTTEVTLESLVVKEEDAWWNQVMLTNLDLSVNSLTRLSPNIEKLYSLTTLTLHNNALESLPKELGKLEKLTRLHVSHNKLKDLPEELFSLPDLRYLNISHNRFEELHPAISDLHMLEHLDVSNNQLTTLPCGVGFLVRLTELLLSKNQISELPADLVNMRSLRHLDLEKNKLTKLPEDMGCLRKLQLLYLQHNSIEELPDFEGCSELQELYASDNKLQRLSETFCDKLPHLKVLELRDNTIIELPPDIGLLQSLTRLDITNNTVTSLPYGLATLAHLQTLQVEGNPIKSIRREVLSSGTQRILRTLRDRGPGEAETQTVNTMPRDGMDTARVPAQVKGIIIGDSPFPDVYNMRRTRSLVVTMQDRPVWPENLFQVAANEHVEIVDLSRNKLDEFPKELKYLAPSAMEVVLSNNCLKAVPTFMSQFARLSLLNLSSNMLTNLPQELGVLQTLRELNISNNRFPEIPKSVYDLKGLEILLVRDNCIANIDPTSEGLGALPRLATLDLTNNDIDYVPPKLGLLKNLRCVELMGNRFRQPRRAVLEKGADALMSYLRDRIPNE